MTTWESCNAGSVSNVAVDLDELGTTHQNGSDLKRGSWWNGQLGNWPLAWLGTHCAGGAMEAVSGRGLCTNILCVKGDWDHLRLTLNNCHFGAA